MECTATRHGSSTYAYRWLGCRCPDTMAAMRLRWSRWRRSRREPVVTPPSRQVDPIAVERACHGRERVPLTYAERAQAVAVLTGRGYSARVIGDRLGLAPRTVQRYRAGQTKAAA